jgi:hypothetical protein
MQFSPTSHHFMKLVSLAKSCLRETHRIARMGKYLFDECPVQIYLKKDSSSPSEGPRKAGWTGIE